MKKALFIVAVALLSTGAYARTYVTPAGSTVDWEYDGANSERKAESWNWPASYNPQDICVIPVKMDFGFWIKVNNCTNLVLKLKQVEIHKYSGTVDVSINTNVSIKVGAYWTMASNVNIGGGNVGAAVTVTPSQLDPQSGTVTVGLTLSSVDLSNVVGGTNCLQVGTVTLQVTPNVTPCLCGGCG
jgi:hypothetical protein